nr:CpsD/CapB family tyrosine-protein kinase [uncultured Ligilactobacillus sp.]
MSFFSKFIHKKTKLDEDSMKYGVALITKNDPQSGISEQYRTVRTNLKFSFLDSNFKVLAIMSALPSEGKSTVSANLAVTWAEEGKKTLLVDADLRRPTVHQSFRVSNRYGLSNIITSSSNSVNISEMIDHTNIDNLDVLTSGPIPPNPAELLGSERFGRLLEFLKGRYDLIILDAPPVDTVTDGQIVATKADGVALVVPQGIATKDAVSRAVKLLRQVKANILGVIMNRFNAAEFTSYYGSYYGGYYGGNYYGIDEKKEAKKK